MGNERGFTRDPNFSCIPAAVAPAVALFCFFDTPAAPWFLRLAPRLL